ncbi:glycerol-3-phosphate phosphatase-like isoform X1 [Vespa mandarinia]|uniref:glycerol-3-phosphate phosphatase-like isoform X1 n=2 Tax=Vespa mandarinia TaxID=7446 RepID=UPI00161F71CE|nr:glycerol-3-phosphate phosphatase-like isoform X1 [Vespa mandarinia]
MCVHSIQRVNKRFLSFLKEENKVIMLKILKRSTSNLLQIKHGVSIMSPKQLTSLSKDTLESFLNSIDIVLSDCDGVLWKENDVITGSPETVNKLTELKKKFFYITNNNTRTRLEFVEKCKGFGYKATTDDIVCTSFLAAVYLKEKQFKKTAYIIGSTAIGKELEEVGIKHCGIGPDAMEGDELDLVKEFKPDPDIGAVIIGFDKYFSYPKLLKATTYLANPNVHFIGTNCDTDRPSPNTNKYPGSGCFIKAVEVASNRSAIMLGKPETFLSEYITKKYNLNPERTLMIGDNLKTDILLGKRCGFKTLLVLSGVTTKSEIESIIASEKIQDDLAIPDFYTNQLLDVFHILSNN